MNPAIAADKTFPRRLVIKLGTNVLTAGTDRLHRPRMVELVRQIAEARALGVEVVLVRSGAGGGGPRALAFPAAPTRPADQAADGGGRPEPAHAPLRADLRSLQRHGRPDTP